LHPTHRPQRPRSRFLYTWITHFCALDLCFLAGTSITFKNVNERATPSFPVSLDTGLWLIFLEFTSSIFDRF